MVAGNEMLLLAIWSAESYDQCGGNLLGLIISLLDPAFVEKLLAMLRNRRPFLDNCCLGVSSERTGVL